MGSIRDNGNWDINISDYMTYWEKLTPQERDEVKYLQIRIKSMKEIEESARDMRQGYEKELGSVTLKAYFRTVKKPETTGTP
jgi:sugar-specific transcriptional regulator TrmB